mmetsp:Transcript_20776/g.29273  ORF Transcript_20776/g.29273 Transcript_20776/m.29273 type:complete len:238 (+) Transcript_20776:300-1013(+)
MQSEKAMFGYPSNHNSCVFVAIDCEKLPFSKTTDWDTLSVAAVLMPENTLLGQIQVGNPESRETLAGVGKCIPPNPTSDFWKAYPVAYQFNCDLIRESVRRFSTSKHVEEHICKFVESLRELYPRFWLISDNPSFDIRIIDNILHRHGNASINFRSASVFLQPICSWSFKRALQMAWHRGVGKPDVSQHLSKLRPIDSEEETERLQRGLAGRHTPLYDALVTVYEFWELQRLCHINV